ncbi:MAG: hypothetical protein ABJN26_16040 [Stappiaceae bacterium]
MNEEEQQKQDAQAREDLKRDMAELLKTPFGRNVLWQVLHKCHVYGTSYGADGHSAFTDGRRFIGVQLIAAIQQVSPTAYADLLREMTLRDYERAQAAKSAAGEETDDNTGEGAQ